MLSIPKMQQVLKWWRSLYHHFPEPTPLELERWQGWLIHDNPQPQTMQLFENELRQIAEIKAEMAQTKRRFRRVMFGLSLGSLAICAGAAVWIFVL